jgi:dihydroflavonol-4-reductase
VNVDDCADGLVRIAEQANDGDEFLLCADAVPFRRWFELIAAGAGRRPPVAYVPTKAVRRAERPVATLTRWFGGNAGMISDTVEIATRHQAFSGARARRELGWAPRDLRQGMAEMCGAIRADNMRTRSERRAARRRR